MSGLQKIVRIIMRLSVFLLVTGPVYAAETVSVPIYSVQEAIAAKEQDPRTIYVDTRGKKEFQAAHIPSSVNIPLHFVKAKTYLKVMKTILVNQGYNLEQLRREGRILQKRGFDVAILAGGIAAWHQQGHLLEQENFAEQDFSLIPANELLQRNSGSFFGLVADVSAADQQGEEEQGVFPGTVLRHPVSSGNDLSGLVAIIESRGLDERDSVLVFEKNGEYSRVKSLTQRCRPTVFFLQGGLKEYERQLERQRAMLEPREKRLKKVGGCSSCPSASGQNRGKEEL